MAVLSNTISGIVPSQLPEYIRDNYPMFQQLMVSYFKFLEDNSSNSAAVYGIRTLNQNFQVDNAPDEFLQYFQDSFLPNFPQQYALDVRKLLKVATKFYQTKGSQNSIEFLFRVLYNLEAQVFYPSQNILRASGGKWQLPQAIKLTVSAQDATFNVAALQGRFGTGTESNTTCVIESVYEYIDETLNQQVIELYLSSVSGSFTPGESISINLGTNSNGSANLFIQEIIGSLSSITVDPLNQGIGYVGEQFYANGSIKYNGDPVSIIGGYDTANGIEAVAYVQNVSQGSVQSVSVDDGGYGFILNPNTVVTVINGEGDVTGTGANVIVNGVDSGNQEYFLLNTDSIKYKANVALNVANYAFANIASANIDTIIGDALSFANIAVAPLSSLSVVSGGSGYTQIPTLSLRSIFNTDYSLDLWEAYLAAPTKANYNTYITNVGSVKDLGRIAGIKILSGGANYTNVTDVIVVDSEIGMDANLDFVTDDNGSITQVIINSGGVGYSSPKPNLLVVNSANYSVNSNGTGAVFQAYGDSNGDVLSLSVSQIGQILSIRMENNGFDYTSTPNISLRNEDVTITPLSNSEFYYQGDLVYQGANANSSTFLAYVDGYDRANAILRLYNYTGTINLTSDLIGTNINSTPISVEIYGNGKARANAQFFGGLIKYPGFWLGTSGFLSSDQYLQSDTLYQNYSYLVSVERNLSDYYTTLKKIVHPSGMLMSAIRTVTGAPSVIDQAESKTIQIANTDNYPGTVTIDADGNGSITGFGTTFLGNVNVGDLFVISSNNTNRIQVKNVVAVINDTALLLESNTEYFGPDRLIIVSGSDIVTSTAESTNLAVNDIIFTNTSTGNAQTSIVTSITGNSITINTTYGANSTNTGYLAFPVLDNVAYEILRG